MGWSTTLLEMLRIEKTSNRLRLIGRIQADCIACIRSAMDAGGRPVILDLSDVTLVDGAAVRFLIACEDEGIELVECPAYIREWMIRELAEGSLL